MKHHEICDLRTAVDFLREREGHLIEIAVPAGPHAEIAGIYRYIGAGGTVMRPTKTGPAMLFTSIKGHPFTRVLIGLLGSRERVGLLLGCDPGRLGFYLNDAVKNAVPPVTVQGNPPCREVIHRATDEGFDIRKLLPAPTNTEEDAGPYITMGMAYASDPETGDSDITIHRLCLQGKDELSMFFTPGARHLDVFRKKAEEAGQSLPISISIGVDPAIELASCFEPPTTPLGFDELSIAGALRGRPVELTDCLTIPARAIAHAEYVIEGELVPHHRIREDRNTGTGKAMPEFPGYTGEACQEIPVIKVTAVTHRKNPIMQTVLGPGEEHVNLVGIPTEASIIRMVEKAMPGKLLNVFAHSSGGGKLMAVMQFRKTHPSDEGRQRQAAMLAFSAFSELKHLFIVDEDVDPFDSSDVLWAMNTRFQGDMDIITIPGVRCHPLDPSQSPDYNPLLAGPGVSCKTIFDCTVPFHLKARFRRAQFKTMDYQKYLGS